MPKTVLGTANDRQDPACRVAGVAIGENVVGNYDRSVVALLFLLFLVVPFVELFVILQVGRTIGALNTIAVLVLVSVAGAWLVKREGLSVVRRAQERVARGAVPGREMVDGVLILFAGALLLTPGFVTDAVGVLLLLPPIRSLLRATVVRQLGRRAQLGTFRGGRPF